MKNIELFNLSAAEILSECYKKFPVRIDMNDRELAAKVLAYYDDNTSQYTVDVTSQLCDISSATMQWLEQAGYIWVGGREHNYFFGITLSHKGLARLTSVATSNNNTDHKESLGDLMLNEAKAASKESVVSAIQLLLAAGAE